MSREMDRAWFSCLLRDPARKRSGSIFTTSEPTGALMDWIDCHKTMWNRTKLQDSSTQCNWPGDLLLVLRLWPVERATWPRLNWQSVDLDQSTWCQCGRRQPAVSASRHWSRPCLRALPTDYLQPRAASPENTAAERSSEPKHQVEDRSRW